MSATRPSPLPRIPDDSVARGRGAGAGVLPDSGGFVGSGESKAGGSGNGAEQARAARRLRAARLQRVDSHGGGEGWQASAVQSHQTLQQLGSYDPPNAAAREMCVAINSEHAAEAVEALCAARVRGHAELAAYEPLLERNMRDSVLSNEEALAVNNLVGGSAEWSPLLYAVVGRKEAALQSLLKSYPVTPSLHVFVTHVTAPVMAAAVEWGNSTVFEWLLLHGCGFSGHGVDLKRFFDVEEEDSRGRTFLMRLCAHPGSAAARLLQRLLMEEPNIDAEDAKQATALHLAAERGSVSVTKALMENYADPNAADEDGVTPLHIASANCSRRIAVMLIKEAGADVSAVDAHGRSALHYAFIARVAASRKMRKLASLQTVDSTGHVTARVAAVVDSLGSVEECRDFVDRADAIIEFLLDNGADPGAKDNNRALAYGPEAQFQWYASVHPHIHKVVRGDPRTAYNHAMFQDVRTQIAVNTVWLQRMQCRKLAMLLLWLISLGLCLYVAVDETGRNAMYVNAFHEQLELAFLEENWGTSGYEQVFVDIQNYEDMYSWMSIALRAAVYNDVDTPRVYRVGSAKHRSITSGGSVHGFNFFLGRPRVRQIRSDSCSFSDVGLSTVLEHSPLYNATCFQFYEAGEVTSTQSFKTGTYTWDYQDSDVPTFGAFTTTYDGSGFSILMPEDSAVWDTLVASMQSKDWYDMNSRFIVVEAAVINPGENLYAVLRFGFEFPTVGGIFPSSDIRVVKLLNYVGTRDVIRLVCELLLSAAFLVYLAREAQTIYRSLPQDDEARKAYSHVKVPYCTCNNPRRDLLSKRGAFKCFSVVGRFRYYDTGIVIVPWFYDFFNALDVLMFLFFLAVVSLHIYHIVLSKSIEWSALQNENLFVNVYTLADVTLIKAYCLGALLFVGCLKLLDYLRISRNLSAFVLVLQGMLAKIGSFLTVFITVILAFAGVIYVSFGTLDDQVPTFTRAVMDTFSASMNGVELTRHMINPQFWLGPLISVAMAIILVIVLFNLLIAVMTEAYEELKDRADAIWAFTQFEMLVADKEDDPGAHAMDLTSSAFADSVRGQPSSKARNTRKVGVAPGVVVPVGSAASDAAN